jgi:hypothetical protein
MRASPTSDRSAIPPRFAYGEEFLRALGNVDPLRFVFDPWPGTATKAEVIRIGDERERFCGLVHGSLIEIPLGFIESAVTASLIARLVPFASDNEIGYATSVQSPLRMKYGSVRLSGNSYISRG